MHYDCVLCMSVEAEKVAEVAAIQYDRMIMEKKKQKEMSDVENQAHEARIKSQADADFYLIQKQAESNKVGMYVWNLMWCASFQATFVDVHCFANWLSAWNAKGQNE